MLFKHKQRQSKTQLHNDNRGVTLVEVIAVIAVLSIVMAAVTGFVITGAKMSAQVSGTATASAREQTAVEFIQKTLQGMPAETIAIPDDSAKDSDGNFLAIYKAVADDENGTKYEPFLYHTEDGKVVYNNGGQEVELCSGTIYFKAIEANTVTYYLNGTPHVVHLRTA